MKAHLLHEAQETFEGTNLQIFTGGKECLGGSVGNKQFVRDYITSSVQEWITNVEVLSEIALCHPQAALTVLTQAWRANGHISYLEWLSLDYLMLS